MLRRGNALTGQIQIQTTLFQLQGPISPLWRSLARPRSLCTSSEASSLHNHPLVHTIRERTPTPTLRFNMKTIRIAQVLRPIPKIMPSARRVLTVRAEGNDGTHLVRLPAAIVAAALGAVSRLPGTCYRFCFLHHVMIDVFNAVLYLLRVWHDVRDFPWKPELRHLARKNYNSVLHNNRIQQQGDCIWFFAGVFKRS